MIQLVTVSIKINIKFNIQMTCLNWRLTKLILPITMWM